MRIAVLDLVFECIPSRGKMVNSSTLMMFGYNPAPTTALMTAQFLLLEFKSLISPGPRCLIRPRLLSCARICRLMPATISIVPESKIDISTLLTYDRIFFAITVLVFAPVRKKFRGFAIFFTKSRK